jgi:hypothetical protein
MAMTAFRQKKRESDLNEKEKWGEEKRAHAAEEL